MSVALFKALFVCQNKVYLYNKSLKRVNSSFVVIGDLNDTRIHTYQTFSKITETYNQYFLLFKFYGKVMRNVRYLLDKSNFKICAICSDQGDSRFRPDRSHISENVTSKKLIPHTSMF